MTSYTKQILDYFRATLPVVSLSLSAPAERENAIEQIFRSVATPLNAPLYIFDVSRGVLQVGFPTENGETVLNKGIVTSKTDSCIEIGPRENPINAVLDGIPDHTSKLPNGEESPDKRAIYVLIGLHRFLSGDRYSLEVAQRVVNLGFSLKRTSKRVILMGFDVSVSREYSGIIYSVEQGLPTADELAQQLPVHAEELKGSFTRKGLDFSVNLPATTQEKIVRAAQMLSGEEFYNAIRLHAIANSSLDEKLIQTINDFKIAELKKLGVTVEPPANVAPGGLQNFRNWLEKRSKLFWVESKSGKRVPQPKGVLAIGVSGCGKSLMAKTVGSMWNIPVLRVDLNSMFGSLVGETEERMRRFITLAEACAPCVVFLDEIEKALSGGTADYQGDGGVSTRMIGTLLSWMQDKTSKVFVMATANNISAIREKYPELLRKGRFDEIFFVDLPKAQERVEILKNHALSYGVSLPEAALQAAAELADGYIGAELENAITTAAALSYNIDSDEYDAGVFAEELPGAVCEIIPMSLGSAGQIAALREFAREFAQPASLVQEEPKTNKKKQKTEAQGIEMML